MPSKTPLLFTSFIHWQSEQSKNTQLINIINFFKTKINWPHIWYKPEEDIGFSFFATATTEADKYYIYVCFFKGNNKFKIHICTREFQVSLCELNNINLFSCK